MCLQPLVVFLVLSALLIVTDAKSSSSSSSATIPDPNPFVARQPYTTSYEKLKITDYKKLDEYLKATFIVKSGILIDLLERSESENLVNRIGIAVLNLWDVIENPNGFKASAVIEWASSTLKEMPGFRNDLKASSFFPGLDFSVLFRILDQFDGLSVTEKASFWKNLKGVESREFFIRFAKLQNPMEYVERLFSHLARHLGRYELSFWNLVVVIVEQVEKLGDVKLDSGVTCAQLPLELYINLMALGAKTC